MTPDQRPSPDLLLEEAKAEHRGKLKIFLGAAPGVGKTFAMLSAAKSRISEGVDTVIGIVETHQRSETEALAQGMESVAKQTLNYRGLDFDEMDLDAVLSRKPKLVLVDELAHTNIPGARHPKRYQDVQEILEAGIDVYTTLNVQHIESLNDIVTRITGVKVRETIPDNIVQMAHAIELIDLPPDELLQRLKDGKVYIPEQARLAVNRFFTPGNLTALRELALRQAAERVDEQMTHYMRRHSITGPWPTSSRVLVCISDDKQAAALVRTARRTAERRQAPWLILYIETSRHALIAESARNDIAQAMAMGENMGAETMTLTSEDVAGEILRVARERNVSTIIIGKSVRSMWSRLTRPSVAAAILDLSDGFDILLVNNHETGKTAGPEARKAAGETMSWHIDWADVTKTVFIIFIASIVAAGAYRFISAISLSPIYVIAVLMAVLDLGLIMAMLAIFLGAISLDMFLTAPHFSLLPSNDAGFISLFFFIAVGTVIAFVGDRMHRQTQITRLNAARTQSLYDYTKSVAAAATTDDVAQATVRRVADTMNARVALLLPRHDRLEIVAAVPADLRLDTASNAAMDWAWHHHKPAGWKSDTLPGAAFFGLPLQAGANTVGVLAVRTETGATLSSDQNYFLNSLAYQAASAIERAKLVNDVAQARLQTETERLRASLLSSISHDLRLPLDNIIASARTLNKEWAGVAEAPRSLITYIEIEADRLDRFVENLLDMTELVTNNVRYDKQPIDLRQVVGSALQRLTRSMEKRAIHLDYPDELPFVDGDAHILRRVFVNVIENALSYSPADQPVTIAMRPEGNDIKITVTDNGPGIPDSERQRVFDMFYRIQRGTKSANDTGGAGLGLSICRGFIEGHQGTISAQPGDGGTGTSIVIRLPIR